MTEEHQQKAPPAFMARLIDPDAQKPVKEVEIALASWQKDLWTALGIPPNSPLRKLAVIGSGATMVCRDRSAEKARSGLGQCHGLTTVRLHTGRGMLFMDQPYGTTASVRVLSMP